MDLNNKLNVLFLPYANSFFHQKYKLYFYFFILNLSNLSKNLLNFKLSTNIKELEPSPTQYQPLYCTIS